MKPNLFAVILLSWAAAASASAAAPNPTNTPTSAPAAPSPSGTKEGNIYAAVDRSIAGLYTGLTQLPECVNAYEYLTASAAKAEKKYTSPDGTVPSHLAAMLPLKRKMADDKRVACITQGNTLGTSFSNVRTELTEFEPRSAKGLAPRRVELTEMRQKANALLARLGAKPAKPSKAPKPTKASDTDEGEEAAPAE